jgi:hypothetical protein
VRLEWSAAPLATSLDATSIATGSWSDTGAPQSGSGSAVALTTLATGMMTDMPHHWRVRVGGHSPYFPHTPWLTVGGTGWTTEHFRAGGSLTVTEEPLPNENDAAPIERFAIESTVPNPFTGRTRITFALPNAGPVRLSIYDVAGRRVTQLVDETRSRGRFNVDWDGRDQNGRSVTPGVYFARLTGRGQSHDRKLVLMK